MRYDTLSSVKSEPDLWQYNDYENISFCDLLKDDFNLSVIDSQFIPQSSFPVFTTEPVPRSDSGDELQR